jgi:RecB family exonuclease
VRGPEGSPAVPPVVDTPTIRVAGPLRAGVTDLDAPADLEARVPPRPENQGSDRLLGTVIHRLFQRVTDLPLDVPALTHTVAGLVRPAEMVDVEDPDAFAATAARLFARLRGRSDVVHLLGNGQCLHEVPFTLVPDDQPGALLRGVIDCIVVAPDGKATVVEFKTGAPRPEHRAQASLYASALAAALGLASIDLKIVYP